MPLDELFQRLIKSRGKIASRELSTDDVLRAIDKLKILGNGFSIIQLNHGRILVQSVPGELSMDQNQVVQAAQESASVSLPQLKGSLGWTEDRCYKVLQDSVREGLAWVDLQDEGVVYWFPSLFKAAVSQFVVN